MSRGWAAFVFVVVERKKGYEEGGLETGESRGGCGGVLSHEHAEKTELALSIAVGACTCPVMQCCPSCLLCQRGAEAQTVRMPRACRSGNKCCWQLVDWLHALAS